MRKNKTVEKESKTLKSIFPKPYEEYPSAVRSKLMSLFFVFIGGGAIMLLLFSVLGMLQYWYLPAIVIVFGLFMILQLAYYSSNDKLREVEGVVIDKERDGYRKQNSYLLVQTAKGAVYRVIATEKSRKYKEGDIVRFYSNADALKNLKDGIYEVRVVYAMERLSAKITDEKEDEALEAIENEESGGKNKNALDRTNVL